MFYDFANNEVIAVDNCYTDTCHLLYISRELTKRLIRKLSLEETKTILLLHESIAKNYNSFGYNSRILKTFTLAISNEAKQLIATGLA